MNITIQGSNNFTLSEKIKGYINKRIEKLSYFKAHITEIIFHLDAEKHNFKVDVTMHLKKLGTHRFEVTDREMHDAIDKVVHKMDVKINREKSKVQDHSKANHEDVVNFFYDHDKDNPEPTITTDAAIKPMSLADAFLSIKDDAPDFFGFIMIETNTIAYLRKIHDDTFSLLKIKDSTNYAEYALKINVKSIEIGDENRKINIEKFNLLDAQKDILDNDYPFDIFIDSSNDKVSLLYKENNGKWKLIR